MSLWCAATLDTSLLELLLTLTAWNSLVILYFNVQNVNSSNNCRNLQIWAQTISIHSTVGGLCYLDDEMVLTASSPQI